MPSRSSCQSGTSCLNSSPLAVTRASRLYDARAAALRGLWRRLPHVVPLGEDSVKLGPVHLGHYPRIDLFVAEVRRRHHRERREQSAPEGGVVLEQRLVGNESLIALDRLEDRATDEPELVGQR